MSERHDPWSVDIEQGALGAALADPKHLAALSAEIGPEVFYDPYHARLYAKALHLRGGGAVTVRTLGDALRSDPAFEETGGIAYLDAMRASCVAFPPVGDYAAILKDLAARRALAGIGQGLVEGAYQSPDDAPTQALTDTATSALLSLGTDASRPSTRPAEVAAKVIDRARAALAGEKVPSIPTGYTKLDKVIGGLQSEDAVFIPGRSGMGKTTLWLNIALHAAQAGAPVLLFSKEMPDFQLTQWLLCCIDNTLRDPHNEQPIHHWKFRVGCLSNFEIARLERAREVLEGLRLEICDDKSLTMGGQFSRARAFARRYPGELGLIGLDFLQNLEDDQAGKQDNREQEVRRLAYGQKELAGMLGWPNLVTVQLKNKFGPGVKKDLPPSSDDIRESGAIEMAADIIFSPHRKAFFHKQNEPTVPHDHPDWKVWHEKMVEIEHDIWLRGLKNRHGDPSFLNIELWADMGAASICNERPGRYHLPAQDEPSADELRF